jgi:hypothetical protein
LPATRRTRVLLIRRCCVICWTATSVSM